MTTAGATALLWTVLGLVFGALAERLVARDEPDRGRTTRGALS